MYKYSGPGVKYLFDGAQQLLMSANKHGGVAFGEFVRKVITKTLSQNFSEVSVGTLHIMFESEGQIDSFLREGQPLTYVGAKSQRIRCSIKGYEYIQFNLEDKYGDKLIGVQLITKHDFFPFDLDVETLCWNPITRKLYHSSHLSVSSTLDNIRNNTILMSGSLRDILTGSIKPEDLRLNSIDPCSLRHYIYQTFLKHGDDIVVERADNSLQCIGFPVGYDPRKDPDCENSWVLVASPKTQCGVQSTY